MSTEIARKTNATLILASKKDLERAIVQIAAVLPPKLSEDMPFKSWVKLIAETVGDHPVEVLNEARSVLLSTSGFAPTPKEFVDAVLAAYPRCKLPLSEDGKRHLAYRKKTSHRYITGEDGRERYLDDAKLGTICFNAIAGVHANMILDKLPEATVSMLERALIRASEEFGKKEKATIKEILFSIEFRVDCEYYYGKFGTPEDLCGGTPANVRGKYGVVRMHYFTVSQEFVDLLGYEFSGCTPEEIGDACFGVIYRGESIFPHGYGTTYQAEGEAKVRSLLAATMAKHAERNARFRAELRGSP